MQIEEQRRALDSNGLRYLISMRSFYIINTRSTSQDAVQATNSAPKQSGRRERLRYRDMIWAFHSESQELLLDVSTAACSGKMTWSDARALGIALWLKSGETLVSRLLGRSVPDYQLFAYFQRRKLNSKLLLVMNTWQATPVIPQSVPFSTSLSGSTNLCTVCGDKQPGIRNRVLC